jgi:hypothetical protein
MGLELQRFAKRSFDTAIALSTLALPFIVSAVAHAQSAPPTTPVVDTSAIDEAICWLMHFQEGSYGALLMAVAGIGSLVSAATGNYRTAVNCLVVGIGSWLIEPIALIMFEYFPDSNRCSFLMRQTMPTGG